MKGLFLSISIFVMSCLSLCAGARQYKYVDASTLTVLCRATEVPGHPFSRLNPYPYGIEGNLAGYSLHTAGVCIAFRTDSRIVNARWITSDKKDMVQNTSALTQKGLDLYIRKDGRWIFAGAGYPDMSGDCAIHEQDLVTGMAEGEKE